MRTGAGERDPTSARWMVLVDEHIMSEEDLPQKYGPMFAASRHNAFQAVLTVRRSGAPFRCTEVCVSTAV
jgi:hypothetical protein